MRLANNPHLLNGAALEKLWEAVIKQAVEDLHNGGLPEGSGETANVKLDRQLEAYHFLMTDRSDYAIRIVSGGADPAEFRSRIRQDIATGRIALDVTRQFKKFKRVRVPKPRLMPHDSAIFLTKPLETPQLVPAE